MASIGLAQKVLFRLQGVASQMPHGAPGIILFQAALGTPARPTVASELADDELANLRQGIAAESFHFFDEKFFSHSHTWSEEPKYREKRYKRVTPHVSPVKRHDT